MSPASDGPPTLPPGIEAMTTGTGLEYLDVDAGSDPRVEPGSRVKLHYRCWLTDGRLVEDTRAAGGEMELVVDQGDVVAGFDEGLLGMGTGGRRRLIVPSDLAYGATGSPPRIPPYATLIYDLEVSFVKN
ncbi:FKBP-type peptidyl-prolyl cis-trans isomerase [bacterium]|nr:FKBP-type peptidyl-prolyl cis-trans isomerase [bacterium]